MEIKDEWFKYFRTFLKENNLYNDFVRCFRNQTYHPIHWFGENEIIRNYKRAMTKRWKVTSHKEFGAMVLTFDSFTWVLGGYNIPREFTKKWCTVGLKWGLYCISHKLEICSLTRFAQLIDYWNRQGWIDKLMLSENELKLIEKLKNEYKNGSLK